MRMLDALVLTGTELCVSVTYVSGLVVMEESGHIQVIEGDSLV